MNLNNYDDAGSPILRERIYTHIVDEGRNMRYSRLEIGFEVGVGTQTGQGYNPKCSVQLSRDGARKWSNEYLKQIGKAGETRAKVVFRRLGISNQVTYRLKISDPVKIAITGSYLR